MMADPTEQFRSAMRDAGIDPPYIIEADGELHRFSTNGADSDKAGWYVFHTDDVPAGAFGCWRSGLSQTWSVCNRREMTPTQHKNYQRRLTEIQRQKAA